MTTAYYIKLMPYAYLIKLNNGKIINRTLDNIEVGLKSFLPDKKNILGPFDIDICSKSFSSWIMQYINKEDLTKSSDNKIYIVSQFHGKKIYDYNPYQDAYTEVSSTFEDDYGDMLNHPLIATITINLNAKFGNEIELNFAVDADSPSKK